MRKLNVEFECPYGGDKVKADNCWQARLKMDCRSCLKSRRSFTTILPCDGPTEKREMVTC